MRRFFKTVNAGTTWTEAYFNDTEGIFYDAMDFWREGDGDGVVSGIALGDPIDGRLNILRTDDAGNTWRPLPFQQRPEE